MKYFLEMEVARSQTGISISQMKYILDLLKETWILGWKPASTPMDPNHKLSTKANGPPVEKGRYQRLVGKLIHLSHTRPNIGLVELPFLSPHLGKHFSHQVAKEANHN